jgi:hypothetical protein
MPGEYEDEAEWLRWKALIGVLAVPAGFGGVLGAAYLFSSAGLDWINRNAGLAAWGQTIGALIAIVIAIIVPVRMHQVERCAARESDAEEARLSRRHIASAIHADLTATIGALDVVEETMKHTMRQLEEARTLGQPIKNAPSYPGMAKINDGVIYKAVAADIGRLPPALMESIIEFYGRCTVIETLANSSDTIDRACDLIIPMIPRFKMGAEMIKMKIKLFEKAKYEMDADLTPSQQAILDAADRVHYPIREIAAASGVDIANAAR